MFHCVPLYPMYLIIKGKGWKPSDLEIFTDESKGNHSSSFIQCLSRFPFFFGFRENSLPFGFNNEISLCIVYSPSNLICKHIGNLLKKW